jgi:hypothetical protein
MNDESLSMFEGRWQEIEDLLGGNSALDKLARSTGALERARKVRDGSQLLRLALGYATTSRSLRLTAAWGAPAVLSEDVSDVALLKRLRASGDFLASVMTQLLALNQAVPSDQIGWEGAPIRLVDGSVFAGPGRHGGQHRLHAGYDPVRRFFTHLDVTDVKKGETLLNAGIQPGDIAVADRNFAKTPQLRAIDAKAAYYVVRSGLHSVRVLDRPDGERVTSTMVLAALGSGDEAELDVVLEETKGGKTGKPAPLRTRLIITRASPATKAREEARIQRSRSRNGSEPSQETKDLAGVVMFLTNLPPQDWPIDRICALYRLRWQIELAFKMLKSAFSMRDVPAKEPRLARTWILANLVAALLANLLACSMEQAIPPSGA